VANTMMHIVVEICPKTLIHALSITVHITLSWRFLLILGISKGEVDDNGDSMAVFVR
jgi:hypothetical protein